MKNGDIKKSPAQNKKDINKKVNAIESFVVSSSENLSIDHASSKSESVKQDLFDTRKKDINMQIRLRISIVVFFFILLLVQNYFLFRLIYIAQLSGTLEKIQPIMAIIIPASLIETYQILKVIVEWTFKDIDYKK